MRMNSQGEGIGPTGTSIRVGPSRRAKPRRSAARSSSGRARALGRGAEALGELHEIRIGEVAGDQPVAELLLLDAAHVAEGAVGEHDRDQRNAVAHRGRQLVRGEHEAAVAGDRQHRHVAAARPARRARWRSPSRDCPGSRARGTCAACRPETRAARQSRSASPRRRRCRPRAARRGSPSRKASCGASLRQPLAPCWPGAPASRRCARRAAYCAPAAPRAAAAGSARRRRPARPPACAGGRAPPDRRRRGRSSRSLSMPHCRSWIEHARADAEHHVGLAPQLAAERQRDAQRIAAVEHAAAAAIAEHRRLQHRGERA